MSRAPSPGGLSSGTLILGALLGFLTAAALFAPGALAQEPVPLIPPGTAHAEIGLPAPVRYAIIRQEPGQVRILYARGDVLFHPQDPTRSWTVERVEAGALMLKKGPQGRLQTLSLGLPIPGFPGLTFAGTALLDRLQYRYKVVDRLRHPDPVLLALEGTRAIVEVEVPRSASPAGSGSFETADAPALGPAPPTRATLDGDLLEKVRVRETSPGLYEVPAADVQAMLDNAGRVLGDLWPTVQPYLSFQTGLEYRISSAAGDGVLSGRGFTVTAPKLAERAGIQVGDTILRVNGQAVNGFASLYQIFQRVRQDPALSTVQVEVDRRGARLTKTYRVR